MNKDRERNSTRTNRLNFGESTRDREDPSTISSYREDVPNTRNNKTYSYNDKYKSSTVSPVREDNTKSNSKQGYRSKVTNLNDRRSERGKERDRERENHNNEETKNRSKSPDGYSKKLRDILYNIEDVYGLRKVGSTGKAITELPIYNFIEELRLVIMNLSALEKLEKRKSVGPHIAELMFVQSYLRYFRTNKLDFKNIEGLKEVCQVLALALHENKEIKLEQHMNVINRCLQTCDNMTANAKNTFSYRYLRLFVLLVLTSDKVHASVMAEFILNQVNYSELGGRRNARR